MRPQGAAPGELTGRLQGGEIISGSLDLAIPLTPAEVGVIELWKVAIHEAAHVVVAQHLGYPASGEVHRTPDPAEYEKLWIGTTRFFTRVEGRDARLIGLAGSIAEYIDGDPDTDAYDLFYVFDDGGIELSNSDAEFAANYTYQDVGDALDLVRSLWWDIEDAAEYLKGAVS